MARSSGQIHPMKQRCPSEECSPPGTQGGRAWGADQTTTKASTVPVNRSIATAPCSVPHGHCYAGGLRA